MGSKYLIGLVLLSVATAASAAPPTRTELNHTSWGKPGVSFEDYRIEGGMCAYEAMQIDVSKTPAAQTMVRASRALDAAATSWMDAPSRWGGIGGPLIDAKMIENSYRVDKQFDSIRDLQYHALRACLINHGYTPFRLTDDQAKELSHFDHRDMDRQRYLHHLGSDAAVIKAQSIPVEELQ